MQPRQMRETCRPVFPSRLYSISGSLIRDHFNEGQNPHPQTPRVRHPAAVLGLTRTARNGCATGLRSTPQVVSCTLSIRGLGSRRGYIGFLSEGPEKGRVGLFYV